MVSENWKSFKVSVKSNAPMLAMFLSRLVANGRVGVEVGDISVLG